VGAKGRTSLPSLTPKLCYCDMNQHSLGTAKPLTIKIPVEELSFLHRVSALLICRILILRIYIYDLDITYYKCRSYCTISNTLQYIILSKQGTNSIHRLAMNWATRIQSPQNFSINGKVLGV
jgi:hypothetical protein